jgi:hypothetical protein
VRSNSARSHECRYRNARIKALEESPTSEYLGVWSAEREYARGAFVTLAGMLAYVCRSHRLSEKQLLAAGRARLLAEARALTAWLALKTQAATLTALAQTFGRSPPSAMPSSVSKNVRESPPLSLRRSADIFMQLDKPDPVVPFLRWSHASPTY